jgi:PTH1 family peptidyl-tRNA hydrolase
MKYLIVGLGNIGEDYADSRHNAGFMTLDAMAKASNAVFNDRRYGYICRIKYKGREFILLKPSTYMNLSGNAVRYWLKKEKIPVENMLVIVDDIALPLGSIRMRPKGSDGGHNGLAHINIILATNEYARIEKKFLEERIAIVIAMIKSFGTVGTELTMTAFNKTGKIPPDNTKK